MNFQELTLIVPKDYLESKICYLTRKDSHLLIDINDIEELTVIGSRCDNYILLYENGRLNLFYKFNILTIPDINKVSRLFRHFSTTIPRIKNFISMAVDTNRYALNLVYEKDNTIEYLRMTDKGSYDTVQLIKDVNVYDYIVLDENKILFVYKNIYGEVRIQVVDLRNLSTLKEALTLGWEFRNINETNIQLIASGPVTFTCTISDVADPNISVSMDIFLYNKKIGIIPIKGITSTYNITIQDKGV